MPKGFYPRPSLQQRFWSNVEIKVNKPDECWEWKASIRGHGYGQFKKNGKQIKAHRLAYELCNGDIPDRMCVLHRCDNRLCVNPAHLFLGTQLENIEDMLNKKRQKGPRKLTEMQVLAIRADKRGKRVIAKELGVYPSTIGRARNGKTWKLLK